MNSPKQILCYLDCYTFLVEQNSDHDYRPMYIGTWNADFEADENGISYFSSQKDSINWPERFQQLYGGKAERWLDHRLSKQQNFACFMELAKKMDSNQALLVMVDLFWLPYSPPVPNQAYSPCADHQEMGEL
ncbi:DUF6005 family protein [Paenibacillus hexagrammi]|uniref:DUF6005 family protein n=1 Tax=Paenibacillus hexagrammi TaxID=2908839 RepID=UPI0021A4E6D0|nr:DUF6005 family protein [Paenibacillus sp. YPD9-1]